ncbi:hypothetical protein LJR153_001778 [Paenibacillus sp. LjRoot153]|uniref:hypothetical protein n=1 Tax=Paenibacillus sp. LjRoot153 TaxID=3342270 RepID=UPI003ECC919B
MTQKVMISLVVYFAIFVYDRPNLKLASGRERLVYLMLMTAALYPCLIYVLDLHWSNLDEWIHSVLKDPAKRIVESVKLSS